MKRGFLVALFLVLVACGSSSLDFTLDTAPKYKDGTPYPMTIEVTEDGEPVTGLDINGTLEMGKMDHGIIEIDFNDNDDGTYTYEVELPMGGEWIISIEVEFDGKTHDVMLTFDVEE